MRNYLLVGLLGVLTPVATEAQDLLTPLTPDTMSVSSTQSDLACLLTDAKLAQRKQALQKEIFSKVQKAEEVADGYVFHFEDEEGMLPVLFQYILAEKECCPFFQQDVSIKPDNGGIRWKISGQEGVKEILGQMLGGMVLPKGD